QDADFMQAQMLGADRGYRFKVYDALNRVAFVISRPLQYCKISCCAGCNCCKRVSTVEGSGDCLGTLRTTRTCCSTALTLSDKQDKEVMTIDGPCSCSRFCSDAEFTLNSSISGSTLGQIKRQFRGFHQISYSKADVFEIQFPVDLSVRIKAVVIGA
ncbi:hypothetical protein PMAYCL1PPCAC_21649, partial [Pristionchus mayeri]